MLTAYTKPLLAEYPAIEEPPKYQRLVRPSNLKKKPIQKHMLKDVSKRNQERGIGNEISNYN